MTTRMGAESATDQAGLACFVVAGLTVLGAVFFGGMAGFTTTEGQVVMAIIGLQALFFCIAGIRFRAGKGAFLGIAAALLLVFEMISKVMEGSIGGGLIINGVLLIVVIQGIRGAFALRSGGFAEDEIDAFE